VPEKWTAIDEVSTTCSSSLTLADSTAIVFRALGLLTFHTPQFPGRSQGRVLDDSRVIIIYFPSAHS
jgi:hypothetical protein